jgi:hypothetical protein
MSWKVGQAKEVGQSSLPLVRSIRDSWPPAGSLMSGGSQFSSDGKNVRPSARRGRMTF